MKKLQIREDRGERRAELMRRVRDELPLRLDHALRFGPGGVQLTKHVVESGGELGDLVARPGLGHAASRVAGSGDLARGLRQRRNGTHRPACHGESGERREDGTPCDADPEEQPEAVDRGVERARVTRDLNVCGPWPSSVVATCAVTTSSSP